MAWFIVCLCLGQTDHEFFFGNMTLFYSGGLSLTLLSNRQTLYASSHWQVLHVGLLGWPSILRGVWALDLILRTDLGCCARVSVLMRPSIHADAPEYPC